MVGRRTCRPESVSGLTIPRCASSSAAAAIDAACSASSRPGGQPAGHSPYNPISKQRCESSWSCTCNRWSNEQDWAIRQTCVVEDDSSKAATIINGSVKRNQ